MYSKPKQMVYNRSVQFDEIAVLVGNFESLQSDDAQELLQNIKTMHPKTLGQEPDAGTAQVYAGLRSLQRKLNLSAEKKGQWDALHHSKPFATGGLFYTEFCRSICRAFEQWGGI